MSEAPKHETKPENQKGPGRIPVGKIWLREMMDLPGHANIQQIDCTLQRVPGRGYFVAHFVPAHQVIELEVFRGDKPDPYRTRIALAAVSRFD